MEINCLFFLRNRKITTKLLLASALPILLISIILGGQTFYHLNQMTSMINEIDNQRVPSLTNLASLDQVTSKMILDQNNMVNAMTDARMGLSASQKAVEQDMDELTKTLDALDSVAKQYKELFNESIQKRRNEYASGRCDRFREEADGDRRSIDRPGIPVQIKLKFNRHS
jgi:hypothetical protein